jgi:cytochrome c556
MMRKKAALAAIAATALLFGAAAAAQLGKPVSREHAQRLMHERHEAMETIGDGLKLVSRELRGEVPNLGRVRQGAAAIARLAPQVARRFPPGTGPNVGKTHAKAEIWQQPADFTAKMQAFRQAALRFDAAARRGNLAAIRAAHSDLGKSCKACHDLYRAKDD